MPGISQKFVAPARVNLLGEHTDYTGGLVLPMAIPLHDHCDYSPRENGQYRFLSDRFNEVRTEMQDDRSEATGSWSDYPVGVLRQLQELGIKPAGFDLHLQSDVPLGAGLSSSASVEVASALAMLSYAGKDLTAEEIALLCQRAENQYVHSPCGIMDQFAVTAAKMDHALLLHTGTLAYEHIPMHRNEMRDTRIVICNSMVKHSIASGEYGNRRREVEAGQAVLCANYPEVKNLGEAALEQLLACADQLSHESFLRCRHIVNENARVREARSIMIAGDPNRLGRLMVEAHASQRDDFACSCDEIDFLVDTAIQLPGCFGARMTGGGFGGCTVNLVAHGQAVAFGESLQKAYRDQLGIDADVYIVDAADGAMIRKAKDEAQSNG